MTEAFTETMWTCSGDSHFIEPPNLFAERLPKELAESVASFGEDQ